MGNQTFLKQARDGVKRLIMESPHKIVIQRMALIDDRSGDGTLVPDPTGTPDLFKMTVRISHEQRQAPDFKSVEAGFSTNLSRFIMVDYKTDIYEGDWFEWNDRGWRIGPVDPLMVFGGCKGYQAPLREAEKNVTDS